MGQHEFYIFNDYILACLKRADSSFVSIISLKFGPLSGPRSPRAGASTIANCDSARILKQSSLQKFYNDTSSMSYLHYPLRALYPGPAALVEYEKKRGRGRFFVFFYKQQQQHKRTYDNTGSSARFLRFEQCADPIQQVPHGLKNSRAGPLSVKSCSSKTELGGDIIGP